MKLGTRASTLALTQSSWVADRLRSHGHEVEVVTIRTRGDHERGSLTTVSGLGVFAAELRSALLRGEVDLAVHSLKDLPVETVPGLLVAAIPERESPYDALCSRDGLTLKALPAGTRAGHQPLILSVSLLEMYLNPNQENSNEQIYYVEK